MANSLLPAMKMQGKLKPLDAVLNLLAKSLMKDEDTPETAGVYRILEIRTMQDAFGLFEVYESKVIANCLSLDLTTDGPDLQLTYQYLLITGRIVEALLFHFVENKPSSVSK